jgi:hypothetical protein
MEKHFKSIEKNEAKDIKRYFTREIEIIIMYLI